MTSVSSSSIAAIGYDESSGDLYIRFINKNTLYCYNGVPMSEYQQLCNAPSIGSYFANNIRNDYPYTRLE
jgi:hypothetical protein